MKKQTVDSIYNGFHRVSAISTLVILASITGYYFLNEIGINKYNGLIRTLIPVALVELVVSVGVINLIDYRSLRMFETDEEKSGDCSECGGTGATYDTNDDNEWEVTSDCEVCNGSGDEPEG